MKKLKLNLQNIKGAQVLTREQLKKIMGGDETTAPPNQVYSCTCTNGATGSWNMTTPGTNGTTPSDQDRETSIGTNCSIETGTHPPSADCSWKTCGNPGVTC